MKMIHLFIVITLSVGIQQVNAAARCGNKDCPSTVANVNVNVPLPSIDTVLSFTRNLPIIGFGAASAWHSLNLLNDGVSEFFSCACSKSDSNEKVDKYATRKAFLKTTKGLWLGLASLAVIARSDKIIEFFVAK